MHLGTLNLWYKAASYKPKFIVPQMYFMIHPQDSLAFALSNPLPSSRRRELDWDPECYRGGPRRATLPTRPIPNGGSILKWVTLEFRLIMHEMNRVTDSE